MKGLENLSYKENLRGAGSPFPGEGSGRIHPSAPVLKGSCRGQKLCLCKELHREDKAQWLQLALGKVSS